jgi:hypothetical protein
MSVYSPTVFAVSLRASRSDGEGLRSELLKILVSVEQHTAAWPFKEPGEATFHYLATSIPHNEFITLQCVCAVSLDDVPDYLTIVETPIGELQGASSSPSFDLIICLFLFF